jgi:hypothetical protein
MCGSKARQTHTVGQTRFGDGEISIIDRSGVRVTPVAVDGDFQCTKRE